MPKQLLLVEGHEDVEFLKGLRRCLSFPNTIEIKDCGSVSQQRDDLVETLALATRIIGQYTSIGVISDADQYIDRRWQSLSDVVKKYGYEPPLKPVELGTILNHPHLPRLGIWLWPNNRLTGILEDYVRLLIPTGDHLIDRAFREVSKLMDDFPQGSIRKFSDSDRPKVVLHTWLAWQKEPGTRPGQALINKYLDQDSIDAKELHNWLTKLYT